MSKEPQKAVWKVHAVVLYNKLLGLFKFQPTVIVFTNTTFDDGKIDIAHARAHSFH